jgi:hypothetical protein
MFQERLERAGFLQPRGSERILLGLLLAAWIVGMWASVDFYRATSRGQSEAPAGARYLPLRAHLYRAAEVDYLMDLPPAERGGKGRRTRRKGQRVSAQYALAPTIVNKVTSMTQVLARARERNPYYLIWDRHFYRSLNEVHDALQPIARERRLELRVQRVGQGVALISMTQT